MLGSASGGTTRARLRVDLAVARARLTEVGATGEGKMMEGALGLSESLEVSESRAPPQYV